MSIKVNNVSFTYLPNTPNSYEALKNVSLEIKTGSFTGIVGHTGSGKSTLVQMFNALLLPTEGEIVIDDFVVNGKSKKMKNIRELRKHVGVVFQFPEYQLFDETIEKDVSFGLKNFGAKNEEALEKARKTLIDLGLNETYFERSPFDLSGGEKRKVALAGILCLDSDILVLDEPTAGLDPKSAREVMDLVSSLHKKGKTIVVITHDMNLLFRFCDHAIVLKNGEVAFDGEPSDLFLGETEDLSIETPQVYKFIEALKKNGLDIPKEECRPFERLIAYLAKLRGNKDE